MRSDQLYFFGTEKNAQLIYNLNFIGLNCKSLKKNTNVLIILIIQIEI